MEWSHAKQPNKEKTMKETVESRVKKIVVQQLGADPRSVTREKYFMDDLGADSLDVVELIMAIEEEFDTCIPERDCDGLKTVGSPMDYLATHH